MLAWRAFCIQNGDNDLVHAVIGGDFDCQTGSCLYNAFVNCALRYKLELSELKR